MDGENYENYIKHYEVLIWKQFTKEKLNGSFM